MPLASKTHTAPKHLLLITFVQKVWEQTVVRLLSAIFVSHLFPNWFLIFLCTFTESQWGIAWIKLWFSRLLISMLIIVYFRGDRNSSKKLWGDQHVESFEKFEKHRLSGFLPALQVQSSDIVEINFTFHYLMVDKIKYHWSTKIDRIDWLLKLTSVVLKSERVPAQYVQCWNSGEVNFTFYHFRVL